MTRRILRRSGSTTQLIFGLNLNDALISGLKAIDIAPDYPLLSLHLGIAYEQESGYEEATAEFEKALQLLEGEPLAAAHLAHAHAKAGRLDQARTILGDLLGQAERRHVDKYSVGLIYVALGQQDLAMDWFDRASKDRCAWFSFMVNGDPRLHGLRTDPRFESLLKRMSMA